MKSAVTRFLDKLFSGPIPRRFSTSYSDNQAYPQVCQDAAMDYRDFNGFRQNPIYNEILEHVSEEQGREFLRIAREDREISERFDEFKRNDEFGGPKVFDYPEIGRISPTTLRYAKVLKDLKRHFGSLAGMDICEVGVGYGGQCRIIDSFFQPANYWLVDIKPALLLAQRYLDNFALDAVLTYRTLNELGKRDFDLFISNYAFSELTRPLQEKYLEKAALTSKRGYMTFNDFNPESFRSYGRDELLKIIPGAKAVPEEPLTHPNNCIIVWGGGV